MTDGEPLRVVIAEDSVLMREGIASLLEGAGFEIVGKSSTADDLLLKVRSYKPHVAIVDIRMPPNHTDEGLVAAKEIREQHPEVGVLVLSQYVEPSYAMELIADDAEGWATCSRTGFRTWTSSGAPFAASPREGRRSTRPSSRNSWADGAATTRSRR